MVLMHVIAVVCALVASCGAYVAQDHHPVGYSYAKFSGPVSGPEHEVHVKDDHSHGVKVDYIAKPDYHFAYGVEDPKSHVSQSRKETRHGDAVHGEYSVIDPDGTKRIVKYTADKHNGFQAQIFTNGKLEVHGDGGHHQGGGPSGHHEQFTHHSGESSEEDDEY
uniref:Putative pupal cuticle protein n=1 Tax=Lutzomyia longipalpis TaxID=7200 RepID=A0A1B0CB87_LUTLO